MEQNISGKLYIVPTPIGNLEDITLRAIRILSEVSLIAAEDTRVSIVLLKHYKIITPIISFHSHNEVSRAPQLISRLKSGENIALISDAGTPGISDPAYSIVKLAIENNIPIEVLPGATALIPALVISGLPSHFFKFIGFLPHKKGRKTLIENLKLEEATIILYESPHRINKTIHQLLEIWGDRNAVLVREISKKFEEVFRETLSSIEKTLELKEIKGEIVLVVEGYSKKTLT